MPLDKQVQMKIGKSSDIKNKKCMRKKEAIVGLFQVQNHYNKLFEKSTLNKKFNT